MTSRNLLVTGGAGFIGSSFIRGRVAAGDTVFVLDAMTYAGHRENLEGVKAELIVGNICDGRLVKNLLTQHSIDGMVCFAAESHVDRSIDAPAAFIETNIIGTYTLLNAAAGYFQDLSPDARAKFRFVQISTDEVYGSLGPTGKFSEQSRYEPNSPYSASKAAADHLVRAWHHTYGLPTITTNCSNNYGPRQYPEKLIPTMITCALAGKPLPVYGDGGNVRDWVHVDDHSAGVSLALDRGQPGATYCFGGDSERNNLDVVRTICRELDRLRPRADGKFYEAGISFVKDRLGHDRRYAIDDSLAVRELGFKRKYRFEEGLAATVKWYLENTAWCDAVLKAAKMGAK